MADKIPVEYTGPFDEVEVATTGLVVKRGETVGLYPALAGRPPSDEDPGAGLLAQVDSWRLAAGGARKVPDGPPAKNASREAWVAFAITEGASEDDLADLGRDELVAKFDPTDPEGD